MPLGTGCPSVGGRKNRGCELQKVKLDSKVRLPHSWLLFGYFLFALCKPLVIIIMDIY